jgi:alkyl hydroperoxide reductase subunit AhpC
VPNFSADTTQGPIESFYEWKANQWAILLSHPADFGPVCTSELAALVTMHSQLVDMNCRVAAVSPNDVASHELWIRDIVAYGNNDASIKGLPFPILADKNRDIATAYNMIDPWSSDMQRIPLTIRSVFIISPNNRLALTLNYPSHVGRNMDEIVRCLYALQQSYGRTGTASIATPANWPLNDAKVSLEDGV